MTERKNSQKPNAVWAYRIGGYHASGVTQGSAARLELDNIRTYCHIVTALKRTMDIQEEIDALFPEIEK